MKKAIFLDKDGTLIHNVHYSVNPDLISLTDGAIEGLKKLHSAGFEFYVISNQQGVALGYFTEEDLVCVKEKVDELLGAHGLKIHGFYYCPHHQDDTCFCRKPAPGLLRRAAKNHAVNLQQSWMIGDILTDILAGKRAGCRTILFDKGYENEWKFTEENKPDFVAKSLDEAAEYILKNYE